MTPPLTFPTVGPAGGAAEAELERALHPERRSVLVAHTHGSSAGSCWVPLLAHVGGAGGDLHGPGQGFPGPGGQAEPAAGGHGRVQLPQSHRALLSWCAPVLLVPANCGKCQDNNILFAFLTRCVWSHRPGPRGVAAGEGPGGPDGVRADAVPQPASALRTFAAAPAGSARRSSQPHLPALLHAAGGQDPHRDADPRHAAIGELHQLALHVRTVKAWKRDEAGRAQGRAWWSQTPDLLGDCVWEARCFHICNIWQMSHQSGFQGNRNASLPLCLRHFFLFLNSGLCSISLSHPVKKKVKKNKKMKNRAVIKPMTESRRGAVLPPLLSPRM